MGLNIRTSIGNFLALIGLATVSGVPIAAVAQSAFKLPYSQPSSSPLPPVNHRNDLLYIFAGPFKDPWPLKESEESIVRRQTIDWIQSFRQAGYSSDRIKVHFGDGRKTEPFFDVHNDSFNLIQRLRGVLDEKTSCSNLTLFFHQHGNSNETSMKFFDRSVKVEEIQILVSQIAEKFPQCKIQLIVESCYAGRFLKLALPNVCVLTSSAENELSYLKVRYNEDLLSHLNSGRSLFEAHYLTKSRTKFQDYIGLDPTESIVTNPISSPEGNGSSCTPESTGRYTTFEIMKRLVPATRMSTSTQLASRFNQDLGMRRALLQSKINQELKSLDLRLANEKESAVRQSLAHSKGEKERALVLLKKNEALGQLPDMSRVEESEFEFLEKAIHAQDQTKLIQYQNYRECLDFRLKR